MGGKVKRKKKRRRPNSSRMLKHGLRLRETKKQEIIWNGLINGNLLHPTPIGCIFKTDDTHNAHSLQHSYWEERRTSYLVTRRRGLPTSYWEERTSHFLLGGKDFPLSTRGKGGTSQRELSFPRPTRRRWGLPTS